MTASRWVSDEVWAALDPRAARLSRRDRWWLAGGAGLFALIALLVALGYMSGLLHTQVGSTGAEITADASTRTGVERVDLHDPGWFGERVDRITSPTPGVVVTSFAVGGLTVPSGGTKVATVSLRFGCAVTQHGDIVLDVHLHRPWGETTVRIQPFGQPAPGGPRSGADVFMHGPVGAACGRSH